MNTGLYLLFIPGFAILAFLTGTIVAAIAMSNGVEYGDEDGEGEPAH
ncbi:MAG: hypothetical protein M3O87_04580 [Candidatus Dormibacteraeota bacterium]|nr:hypothetical protein [Candidatus Dormibacteraeota bacterium]